MICLLTVGISSHRQEHQPFSEPWISAEMASLVQQRLPFIDTKASRFTLHCPPGLLLRLTLCYYPKHPSPACLFSFLPYLLNSSCHAPAFLNHFQLHPQRHLIHLPAWNSDLNTLSPHSKHQLVSSRFLAGKPAISLHILSAH